MKDRWTAEECCFNGFQHGYYLNQYCDGQLMIRQFIEAEDFQELENDMKPLTRGAEIELIDP